MAEPLKHQFGPEVPARIAAMLAEVYPAFKREAFIAEVLDGYETLELMPRGWKIAHALRAYLPENYEKAAEILIQSLGSKLEKTEGNGMASFLYLPHVFFVARYGLEHFEASMLAQYELTQRFTAEFSIRPYLEQHRDATLARLRQWADDPSVHVRRLVSEGTRPRLPWASRLREFQKDPRPVLELLELLKDDKELYVRRSVANNLNDIGKDHMSLLVETAGRWLQDASPQRRWIVNHALRSAIKAGEPRALELIGFSGAPEVAITNVRIQPNPVPWGGAIQLAFDIQNTSNRRQQLLVDFRVHFIKANGKASPKVFKLKTLDLAPAETASLSKKVSLAEMTTRKHFAGTHEIDLILNGQTRRLGAFELIA